MKDFNFENHAKNLPDAYKKNPESNNYKILEIERAIGQTLRQDLQDISDMTDLDNAYGKTLDLYGERVGQVRGQTTDDQYRIMIKAKIMRNISNGSFPSVYKAICEAFNCEPSEIKIVEGNMSGVIESITIPIPIINNAGLSSKQTNQIIKSLLPIGVKLDEYLLEGTFCFSDREDEYDELAGFSDENGEIGGHFGLTESDAVDVILPI